jgi:AbrB family looped-hinge helix DNA binding protein
MPRRAIVTRLSSKGQVVIPADLRRALGLKAGQALAVRTGSTRELILAPVEEDASMIEEMRHRMRAWAARTGRDLVEELHQRRREERRREASRRAAWRG